MPQYFAKGTTTMAGDSTISAITSGHSIARALPAPATVTPAVDGSGPTEYKRDMFRVRRETVRVTIAVLAMCATAMGAAVDHGLMPDDGLMPMPRRVEFGPGSLNVGERLSIELVGHTEPRLDRAVDRFVAHLSAHIGGAIRRTKPDQGNDAVLRIECASGGQAVQTHEEDESYTLNISSQRAVLRAATTVGVLRGLATLEQLLQRDGNKIALPDVRIEDRPRFPWRGLLIDVCRHWQPMPVIKRNLDAMAAVKLNVLHLHLTEDQGFRVESKRFPRLHESGSDGKYFAQDELREIVSYARDRGIRVVPEFDMPGHTTSWLVGHPELAAGPGPFQIERRWGVFDPCFDPTKESLYEFLDEFFAEMTPLFPDPFVHIGGDEVNGNLWRDNPRIQTFMRDNNLADAHALQAYFNRRVAAILAKHGRKMIGWDEILHADLPANCIVQSWRGAESLRSAVNQGFNAIVSNGYYLDHQLSAAFHYQNDPDPAGEASNDRRRARILGGEACMWGEYVSPETIDSRIWPRLAAIAERLWSPRSVNDVNDMYRRLEHVSRQLDRIGPLHRKNYAIMLQRLAGTHSIDPVRVLADVLEPVKFYQRSSAREYTSATPLNRLVDAARPESDVAREFLNSVRRFLLDPKGQPEQRAVIRKHLTTWRDNHKTFLPVAQDSTLLVEIEPVSHHLKQVAEVGLAALDLLMSNRDPDSQWQAKAERVLDSATEPLAEVVIAVIPAVRKLAAATHKAE